MSDLDVEISGLEELQASLKELTKVYPDKAGELLKKDALALRKEAVNNARNLTHTSSEHKRSLGKLSSFTVSQVQGLMADQYVEISAKSPHFHLVEKGHELKAKSGQTIGFVQGVHYLEKAVSGYEGKFEEHISNMVDKLLKEGDLL